MTLVEAKRRVTKAVAQRCTPRRSARLGSRPHSAGSSNGGVESATVAASGGTSRRRPSRSVKALHERNANLGCTENAENLANKPLRRSPRFETQKADCGLLAKIQKRRSPRLIAIVSQGGNKENEVYSVHRDELVRPNVVKLKEERVRKREAKGNRDGTSPLDLRKSPTSAPHNRSRRSNDEIYGNTPKRRSPRFIHRVSDEENEENEQNVVRRSGLVQNGKEEEEMKKVAKDIRDETIRSALRKTPMFASPDEIQRPKCRTSGRTPNARPQRFVHAIFDEDRKNNEENVMVMRPNVKDDVKKRIQEAINCHTESFAGKETKGVTAKVKERGERNETKNSSGQSAAREGTDNSNIISEKFICNGGAAGRKRSASSSLLKDKGGEKKLREYHNKEACVELEVQHHGYHDHFVKRKSRTPLGSFGFLGWSQDQEKALERAYLVTRPSPHFWKEIANLVPGKSAKECFDRIHSIIPTPPTQQPRSRTKRKLSPLGQFSLTGNAPFERFGLKGRISGKKKSILARRAVRHILRKHVLADQGCVPGLGLEGSCSTDRGPSQKRKLTIQNKLKSPCLEINGESGPLGNRNKMPNIVTSLHQQALVSPEILKKVKNLDLHEKYIDRLHIRELTRGRKAAIKRTDSLPAEQGTKGATLDKTETIKYARLALVSDARDALRQIQQESRETETFSEYDGFSDDDNDNLGCERSDFEIC